MEADNVNKTASIRFIGLSNIDLNGQRAILVNARTPAASVNSPGAVIPSHYAFVAVRIDQFGKSIGCSPTFSCKLTALDGSPVPVHVFVLNRATVRIGAASGDFGVIGKNLAPGESMTFNPKAFHWVRKMSLVLPAGTSYKAKVANGVPTDVVSVYVDLRHATVQADPSTSQHAEHSYHFIGQNEIEQIPHARIVLATMTIPATGRSITIEPFEDKDEAVIELLDGGDVEILFGNDPLDELLGVVPDPYCYLPYYHFERFYDLCDLPPNASRPIPICVAHLLAKNGRGSDGGCGPPTTGP